MSANDFQMLPVSAKLAYTFDFSGALSASSPLPTVTDITVTGSNGITISDQSNDYASYQATVLLSGATHGSMYLVQATATMSNGEQIPKDLTVIGSNGA